MGCIYLSVVGPQTCFFFSTQDLTSFVCGLPKESVVDVYAEVTVPEVAIASCTQSGVELVLERAYCISRAANRLPLQLEDAARSEAELRELKLPRVEQNTRLDNRVIDLRPAASQASGSDRARPPAHRPRADAPLLL